MTYVIGAIAGLVFGCIIGVLKDLFIWRKYGKINQDDGTHEASDHSLYVRMIISYLTNIVTLAIAFFVRNVVPFNGIVFLIATGISLSIANHIGALTCRPKNNKQ